jgi:hypothetical protein
MINRPNTVKEIDGLIDHLISKGETENKSLLSKIYIDLGITAGNIFKLRFEKKTRKEVVDPYPSYF